MYSWTDGDYPENYGPTLKIAVVVNRDSDALAKKQGFPISNEQIYQLVEAEVKKQNMDHLMPSYPGDLRKDSKMKEIGRDYYFSWGRCMGSEEIEISRQIMSSGKEPRDWLEEIKKVKKERKEREKEEKARDEKQKADAALAEQTSAAFDEAIHAATLQECGKQFRSKNGRNMSTAETERLKKILASGKEAPNWMEEIKGSSSSAAAAEEPRDDSTSTAKIELTQSQKDELVWAIITCPFCWPTSDYNTFNACDDIELGVCPSQEKMCPPGNLADCVLMTATSPFWFIGRAIRRCLLGKQAQEGSTTEMQIPMNAEHEHSLSNAATSAAVKQEDGVPKQDHMM